MSCKSVLLGLPGRYEQILASSFRKGLLKIDCIYPSHPLSIPSRIYMVFQVRVSHYWIILTPAGADSSFGHQIEIFSPGVTLFWMYSCFHSYDCNATVFHSCFRRSPCDSVWVWTPDWAEGDEASGLYHLFCLYLLTCQRLLEPSLCGRLSCYC